MLTWCLIPRVLPHTQEKGKTNFVFRGELPPRASLAGGNQQGKKKNLTHSAEPDQAGRRLNTT